MNKAETIKYKKLQQENLELKQEVEQLKNKIQWYENLVLDLLVLLFAGSKYLGDINRYFKIKYPNLFDLNKISERGNLILSEVLNAKMTFQFRINDNQ